MDPNTPPPAPENGPPVTNEEKERVWIEAWRRAGPELQQMRDEKTRNADTVRSMQILGGMFLHAVKNYPPKPTSGLVEQQRWFQKLQSQ